MEARQAQLFEPMKKWGDFQNEKDEYNVRLKRNREDRVECENVIKGVYEGEEDLFKTDIEFIKERIRSSYSSEELNTWDMSIPLMGMAFNDKTIEQRKITEGREDINKKCAEHYKKLRTFLFPKLKEPSVIAQLKGEIAELKGDIECCGDDLKYFQNIYQVEADGANRAEETAQALQNENQHWEVLAHNLQDRIDILIEENDKLKSKVVESDQSGVVPEVTQSELGKKRGRPRMNCQF